MKGFLGRRIREARVAAALADDMLAAGSLRRPGADFMLDVLKSLDFEYLFANPASSFGGIHESLINYGGNRNPEFITCTHEQISVSMADGYARIAGRPALVCAHGTVGLQNASMGIYNAFCDRTPVYIVIGNTADAAVRRNRYEWLHSAQDPAAMVRDFIKWDDHPASLEHFAESAMRAYSIAMTPPRQPVVLVADTDLQSRRVPIGFEGCIPPLTIPSPPHGDPGAIRDAARMLVSAENPVIVAGRAVTTAAGLRLIVELAETLQAGVVDQYYRMNFPSRHPLNQSRSGRAAIASADAILGLEVDDFFGVVNTLSGPVRPVPRRVARAGAKLIGIGAARLAPKSNYQDLQRYQELDIEMAADAEATLPALIEAVQRELGGDSRRVIEARGARWAKASAMALEKDLATSRENWDATPITPARLASELGEQIRGEDWSLVSFARRVSNWPQRLWDFTANHQFIGAAGGEGVGHVAASAAGAALANRKHGRLSVSIQTDGDLLLAPGTLWTEAHYRIPLLTVMHNNRAYYEENRDLRRVATRHRRDSPDRRRIGSALDDPSVDFAAMARSFGVEAEGPITDPDELGAAIKRGIAAVQEGRPYLIDAVTQGR